MPPSENPGVLRRILSTAVHATRTVGRYAFWGVLSAVNAGAAPESVEAKTTGKPSIEQVSEITDQQHNEILRAMIPEYARMEEIRQEGEMLMIDLERVGTQLEACSALLPEFRGKSVEEIREEVLKIAHEIREKHPERIVKEENGQKVLLATPFGVYADTKIREVSEDEEMCRVYEHIRELADEQLRIGLETVKLVAEYRMLQNQIQQRWLRDLQKSAQPKNHSDDSEDLGTEPSEATVQTDESLTGHEFAVVA